MIECVKREDCTGCKMCGDLCPVDAISFEVDDKGFWYPKVNNEKCIECGLCVKKCPSLNHDKMNEQDLLEVYSAWSRNDEIRLDGTSGGVFYEIGKKVLEKGGVIAGCKYSEDWKGAEHIIAKSLNDLDKIKGSKYFQSDTEGIYKQVEEELSEGKDVLFCGTPCQNAALKSYLKKEYDNLYCLDFICRSINSPLAFKKYIEELEEKFASDIKEVHLKNKKYGWQSLASQVKFTNGDEILKDKNEDWWVKGFIYNDLYTRQSCFNCKYRKLPRITADITVGDFWGITGQSDEDMYKGISVVMVNSEKGKALFEMVKNEFVFQRRSINSVLPGNPALFKNPVENKEYEEKFFNLIKTNSFSESVRQCIGDCNKGESSLKRKIKGFYKLLSNKKISKIKWFYYNYLCKNIIRKGAGKIIPYKNAVLDLDKSARIIIYGNKNVEIGVNKLKGSRAETHVRMNDKAKWNVYNGAHLFYDSVLEIKENAEFSSGFFSANGGSVIIADNKIVFGEDVMIGRNVIVYDSDFHQLLDKNFNMINPPSSVVIEDHVWLTNNVTVLKGVTIGCDSLIASTTVINKDVPPHSIIAGKGSGNVISDFVNWNRDRVK